MLDPAVRDRDADFFGHFLVVDGRVVGGWRRATGPREVAVTARPLRPLTAAERRGLDAAAARLQASVGLPVRLSVEPPG